MGDGSSGVNPPMKIMMSVSRKNIKRYMKIPIQYALIQLITLFMAGGSGIKLRNIDKAIKM